MKMTKLLSLILGVLCLAGCASTKCQSKTPAAEPVAVAPVAVATAPVAVSEPVEEQEEPETANIPAAVRK
jgi:uncharacterized lipoprotein YbaY